jgi:uncharacterized protein (TIGR03437 family)
MARYLFIFAFWAASLPGASVNITPHVHFEANQGQTDPSVHFLARAPGFTLFLTDREAVVTLGSSHLRMRLAGSNPAPRITGEGRQPGVSHYLKGPDPVRWTTGVARYDRVRYEQVYPGVDLVYYGNERHLEYDFVVAPGADPRRIRMRFAGTRRLWLENGDLLLETPAGILRQRQPVLYQEHAGVRKPVEGGYLLRGGEVGFRIGSYDPAFPLVIDPLVMYYSSYLGGAGEDRPVGVAADQQGNTYVTGVTNSANFPSASPFQRAGAGKFDVFITKLDRERGQVVYSTYLGGTEDDEARQILVDVLGNIYIAGNTSSANFPTTGNAAQRTFGGAVDAFVVKLNPAGSQLIYSTYLGGTGDDVLLGFDLDNALNAYLCGATNSTNFPRSAASFGPSFGGGGQDGFVAKLNTAGSQLIYSGYLGGRGAEAATAVAANTLGGAFVTGWTRSTNFPTEQPLQAALGGLSDAFLVKLLPDGIGLEYASFLGGSLDDAGTSVLGDLDDDSVVTVAGFTASSNFPRGERTIASDLGDFNAFIAGFGIRLAEGATEAASPDDPRPAAPTRKDPLFDRRIRFARKRIRCAGQKIYNKLIKDAQGNLKKGLIGIIPRVGPILAPLEDICSGFSQLDFVSEAEDGVRQSTPLSFSSMEILDLTTFQSSPGPVLPGPPDAAILRGAFVDRFDTIHVVAETEDSSLPVSTTGTTANRGTVEGYIARYSENPPPPPGPAPNPNTPRINSALNGASFATSGPGVAPGSIISLFGERLATATAGASATPLPTTLGGASVTIAGRAAPLFYVSATQVNAQVPYETPTGQAAVVVAVGGVASAAINMNVAAAAPGIFTFETNRAVVQNQNFSVNTASNPAQVGSIITAYLTGGGGYDNASRLQSGVPTPPDPLNRITLNASATIGGQNADILFLGLTPGLIGVVQANVRVPPLAAGNHPLALTIGGVASNGPLVSVQ